MKFNFKRKTFFSEFWYFAAGRVWGDGKSKHGRVLSKFNIRIKFADYIKIYNAVIFDFRNF